uniref:Large ribosomal subunit protein bL21m n=1 Tax=Polytomella parva TaxID=51329 RepID=A0A7S0USA9_9CHLO|mmetsp:Transcript_19983/g.35947  ORF Transcript_19983/g.35947 Transcript_19983/m.35947 type:complete len:294 (+) Transcript_19983:46-927(+)
MALRRAVLAFGDKLSGRASQTLTQSLDVFENNSSSGLFLKSQLRNLSIIPTYNPSLQQFPTHIPAAQCFSLSQCNRSHNVNSVAPSCSSLVIKRYARTSHKDTSKYLKLASEKAVESVIPDIRTVRWSDVSKGPAIRSCIPAIPEIPKPEEYKTIGTIEGPYSLNLERVFGVVELSGTQYKVTVDDVIFSPFMHGVEVNDVIMLERVMLLGSRNNTIIGRPYVPGACILAAVEEHFLDGTVHVFKRHKRKRYRRYKPVRPMMTTLRILKVVGIDPAPGDELGIPNGPTIKLLS